jgi:hypothetical protein
MHVDEAVVRHLSCEFRSEKVQRLYHQLVAPDNGQILEHSRWTGPGQVSSHSDAFRTARKNEFRNTLAHRSMLLVLGGRWDADRSRVSHEHGCAGGNFKRKQPYDAVCARQGPTKL